MNDYLLLVGRIFIAAIFLVAGLGSIAGFAQTKMYMAQYGMPLTGFLLVCAIIMKLAGSIMVMLGFCTRTGVALLVVFLIPATLIFHTNFGDQMQQIQFLKNLATLGGLLYIWASGAGKIAIRKTQSGASGATDS